MNTRPVLDPYKQHFALAAAFNADNSFFSVAHDSGFKGELLFVLGSSPTNLDSFQVLNMRIEDKPRYRHHLFNPNHSLTVQRSQWRHRLRGHGRHYELHHTSGRGESTTLPLE